MLKAFNLLIESRPAGRPGEPTAREAGNEVIYHSYVQQ